METITITKEKAEFIKNTCTKEINTGKNWQRTFYLPRFFALTEVMIDCNVVSGKHDQTGNLIEYNVEFSDEAQEILDIY
jgi:hypothetical protein